MNTESRLKVEMALRVRNFLRANPFGTPNADAVVARFEEHVARAQHLLAQQIEGFLSASTGRAKPAEVRRRFRKEPLRQLTEIAQAAALENPELAHLFRPLVKNPN